MEDQIHIYLPHLFTKKEYFYVLQPIKSQVTQVSGEKSVCEGIGIVIIHIPKTDIAIPLYPAYYAPEFPQNTVSPTVIKHYNKYRRVTSEALAWIQMVSHIGQKIYTRINPVQVNDELLDYININIMSIDMDMKEEENSSNLPSFNKSSAPMIPDTITQQ